LINIDKRWGWNFLNWHNRILCYIIICLYKNINPLFDIILYIE
jgi:hypothetical protein